MEDIITPPAPLVNPPHGSGFAFALT